MNSFDREKRYGGKPWGDLASVVIALVLGVLVTQFFNFAKEFGGRPYDPSDPKGLVLSRRLAYEATPLLDAIAAYRKEHGKIPTLEELRDSSLLSAAYKSIYLVEHDRWHYLPENDGQRFQIRVKLGWDPDLWYDSKTNKWEYVPGDGTESTVIDS